MVDHGFALYSQLRQLGLEFLQCSMLLGKSLAPSVSILYIGVQFPIVSLSLSFQIWGSRKSKSERARRSTDRRRSHSITNDNADQTTKEQPLEQKPRRSRHRSSVNSLSRFSCSAIDQSAIIPFKQPPASKPVKAPVFLSDPPTSSSSLSSSPGVTEVVVLRVSLHCQGCAGKVKKHIAKMEGVTSFNVDLPKQKVTVVGNVTPVGVLESISRVKNAELWPSTQNNN
ncbi:hypothetical protein SUGI_0030780 [Cryptomeria japonica]|nr:hypothetical protein SUGI_0030780 [Cryptomeria japonica]